MTTIDAESSGTAVERRRRRSGSQDRKSTRLNSSHLVISYAVFCLKKKKKYHVTSLTSHHHTRSLISEFSSKTYTTSTRNTCITPHVMNHILISAQHRHE